MADNGNSTGNMVVAIVAVLAVVLIVAVALRLFQGQGGGDTNIVPDVNVETPDVVPDGQ